jgi:hypothetical protein
VRACNWLLLLAAYAVTITRLVTDPRRSAVGSLESLRFLLLEAIGATIVSGQLPPIDDSGIAARHLHRYNPTQAR